MKTTDHELVTQLLRRRQWIDELAQESQQHENASLEMVGWLIVLGMLFTIILLVWVL